VKIAVSVGDLNGVGFEIALSAHETVKKVACPLYCLSPQMAKQAASLLGRELPPDFECIGSQKSFDIAPGTITAQAGAASFAGFVQAVDLAAAAQADAVVTLPIHKAAWAMAGLSYRGHTDYLRACFDAEAIMMLGRPGFYVALFTDHIPLRAVPGAITTEALEGFLYRLSSWVKAAPIGVLGLNPHASDGGVLGDEERFIEAAIARVNHKLNQRRFEGPLIPDAAFLPHCRDRFALYVAMYHDQGLAPLKALVFEEAINVTLGLPIVRTSVDHGTAFDIAYRGASPSIKSYLNAVTAAKSFLA
jgi:4-hydroxythreonine-4-phosphate dehydrogenase